MMEGRFFLGVGTGENLNEHIFGDRWPPHDVRLEMLEESVEVIRQLWQGGEQTFRGEYYTVENARIYTLPKKLPEIMVAAAGPKTAEAAGRFGDGLICVSPDEKLVKKFEESGGKGKPRVGQFTVCWAESEEEAISTAYEWWPNAALKGELSQELPTPKFFEQASKMVKEEDVAEAIICGPDPKKHLEMANKFINAGFSHVYVHQVGPDQEGCINFYQSEVMPKLARKSTAEAKS
jgi:G6PDH family F420-dependent oxidoreductase